MAMIGFLSRILAPPLVDHSLADAARARRWAQEDATTAERLERIRTELAQIPDLSELLRELARSPEDKSP